MALLTEESKLDRNLAFLPLLPVPLMTYMGYFLPKSDGSHDIVVNGRQASDEVLRELSEVTAVVGRLHPIAIALAVVQRCYTSMADLEAKQKEHLESRASAEEALFYISDLMVDWIEATNAYLAAASSLLGQLEKHISKHFGKNSDAGKEWHRQRRLLHAGSLSYRLLYELRNYSQHYELPVGLLRVNGTRNPSGSLAFSVGALVDRDRLLESGYDWKARRADIAAQPEHFALLPLAAEYLSCLKEVVRNLAALYVDDVVRLGDYFDAVRRSLNVPDGARMYVYPGHVLGSVPTNAQPFPEDQFKWILRQLSGKIPGFSLD